MHLLRRWVHLWHTYVCPHGSTIGTRSAKLNSSKQMTQWNGMIDAAPAATFDSVPITEAYTLKIRKILSISGS
jgi:hypothetical protein